MSPLMKQNRLVRLRTEGFFSGCLWTAPDAGAVRVCLDPYLEECEVWAGWRFGVGKHGALG